MLLVVGLGNPGTKYASHRHNVGFMAVDALARAIGASDFKEKWNGELAKAEIAGEPVAILKPQTYMNESGRSVQGAAAFFKTKPSEVLVVHDELDLPWKTLRLKVGGGHAGHNGLRSIIACFGSPDFARLRVGIGRPPAGFRGEVADFVLAPFDAVEKAELPDVVAAAVAAMKDVASRGLAPATSALHTNKTIGADTASSREAGKAPPKQKTILAPGDVPGPMTERKNT